MYFYEAKDQDFANEICIKAITEGVCGDCKCTDTELTQQSTGVICFYGNGYDYEWHKKIISFMFKYNLFPKISSGRYINMSFKFDAQTRNREYGDDFKAKITLEDFVDLWTGNWLSSHADVIEKINNIDITH